MDTEAVELGSPPGDGPRTLTVSELTQEIRFILTASGVLRGVAVRGEVVDLAVSPQGHVRFRLRDEGAVVDCIMFRTWVPDLEFEPADGQEVLALGDVEVYPPRGNYQLLVKAMQPWGVGSQHLALVRLRDRLKAEGLFRSDTKRPLPPFPSTVGVVTSEGSAALQDILAVLRRRWPLVHVLLAPAPVQGPTASAATVEALALVAPRVDVVLLARGGGSEGDLAAYNDEALVRAVRACPVPVVSAIGHEVDNTLVDLAADLRAPTPSAAAELLTPDGDAMAQGLEGLRQDLGTAMAAHLEDLGDAMGRLREDTLPLVLRDRLPVEAQALTQALETLVHGRAAHGALWEERLEAQGQLLDRVNPRAVLERGYALLRRWSSGRPVEGASDLAPGELLVVDLWDGEALCQVLQVDPRA